MNSLLRLRKECGLSQQALADYIGVSRRLVKFAEKALRELPKTAKDKLANVEKLVALGKFSKEVEPVKLDAKQSKELKNHHKLKIADYLYKVDGLRLKLSAALKARQKLEGKIKLIKAFSKKNANANQNEIHNLWTERHASGSNEKLSKHNSSIAILNYEIEVQLGYALVHEKILKRIL